MYEIKGDTYRTEYSVTSEIVIIKLNMCYQ